MSDQEIKQEGTEDQEFPVDPQVDAMFAAAGQFVADLRQGAENGGADQETLDYIDQQRDEIARFRKEDPMLSDLFREAREALKEDHDDMEETFTGWVGELRDRRRKEVHHLMMSMQGGCEGCEGCG